VTTITFLSDYGRDDDFVGVCHGVMAGICPAARIIDITHGLPRHEVRPAALVLRNTLPYMPVGVHLAVVDPEVGSQRRPVAVRLADGRILVGPDNGLLALAAQRCGGVVEAVDVGRSGFRREPVSATFHGRDVFAPVAAHLAAGEVLGAAGDPIDPDTLAQLALPRWRREGDAIVANVLYVDRFGNAALDITHDDLAQTGFAVGDRLELDRGGERFFAHVARMFVDVRVGEILVYEDAYGTLAVAINRGNAAETLQLAIDAELVIRRA